MAVAVVASSAVAAEQRILLSEGPHGGAVAEVLRVERKSARGVGIPFRVEDVGESARLDVVVFRRGPKFDEGVWTRILEGASRTDLQKPLTEPPKRIRGLEGVVEIVNQLKREQEAAASADGSRPRIRLVFLATSFWGDAGIPFRTDVLTIKGGEQGERGMDVQEYNSLYLEKLPTISHNAMDQAAGDGLLIVPVFRRLNVNDVEWKTIRKQTKRVNGFVLETPETSATVVRDSEVLRWASHMAERMRVLLVPELGPEPVKRGKKGQERENPRIIITYRNSKGRIAKVERIVR